MEKGIKNTLKWKYDFILFALRISLEEVSETMAYLMLLSRPWWDLR